MSVQNASIGITVNGCNLVVFPGEQIREYIHWFKSALLAISVLQKKKKSQYFVMGFCVFHTTGRVLFMSNV